MSHQRRRMIDFALAQSQDVSMGQEPEDRGAEPLDQDDGCDHGDDHASTAHERIADHFFGLLAEAKGILSTADGSLATREVPLSELMAMVPDMNWETAVMAAARVCGWPHEPVVVYVCDGVRGWIILGGRVDIDGAPIYGHVVGDFDRDSGQAARDGRDMLLSEGLF